MRICRLITAQRRLLPVNILKRVLSFFFLVFPDSRIDFPSLGRKALERKVLQYVINSQILLQWMEGDSLQAKQQYLREKIIDAGHDAEQFVEFCSQRHNIDDLQNWSMRELIDIVQAFLKNSTHISNGQVIDAREDTSKPVSSGLASNQAGHVGEHKLGVVFSEDDWSILLAGPSLLDTAKTAKKEQNPVNPFIPLDLTFETSQPQNQPEANFKDFPLSPPSIDNNPKAHPRIAQVNKPETQPQVSIVEQIKIQKKMEKRQTNAEVNIPINLSNILLSTAKEKTLQPLPNVTDVSVTKTEQISRNFLQGDYTLYHITFTPCQTVIQRKFADLLRMRGILQRLYPFLRLPYLEPQGWLASSEGKDPQTLQKYKWMVEEFFRYLMVKSEQLRNSEVVRFFCGFTKKQYTKQEFRKKLEAYDCVPRPKFLGEVILTNHTLQIPPMKSVDKYNTNTLALITQIDIHYERLRKQLDVMFANYELMIKSYTDLGNTFDSLELLMRKYNKDNEDEPMEFQSFESLKEMTVRLINKSLGECEIFRKRIKNMFRYQRQNMTTIKQLVDFSSNIHYEFSRQGFPSLPTQKVKGSNMEIETPVPLEQPVKSNKPMLAVQQVFWSFMIRRESARYWDLLRRKINECLTLIAYDELDSQNQNLNFWNTMIKRCVI